MCSVGACHITILRGPKSYHLATSALSRRIESLRQAWLAVDDQSCSLDNFLGIPRQKQIHGSRYRKGSCENPQQIGIRSCHVECLPQKYRADRSRSSVEGPRKAIQRRERAQA